MNKKTIITILLALVAVSGWAQKVWTNPGYRNEPHGFQFDVNEVEFLPDETVLHITVRNHPNAKFSFGKCTVLKTEDGRSYPIISAMKTRNGETDLALGRSISSRCLKMSSSLTLSKAMPVTSLRFGT